MGVLWLLSMTIICHTTKYTTAWSGGNQSTPSTTNINKQVFENRTVIIRNELPKINSSEKNTREKRGTISNENGIEAELDKRDPMKFRFSSWGGKRAYYPEDKRAKFSSWGGKRNNEIENNEINEDIEEQKRAKFSSWGGKRNDDEGEKTAKFSYWPEKKDLDELIEDKRSKFNSWAGKRIDLGDNKRAKFSSWAGKRARFNSWAGKRTPFNSWAGKRSNIDSENEQETSEGKRAKFSSWAGKREPKYVGNAWNRNSPNNHLRYYSNGEDLGSENIMKLWQDLMSRKRARFSSWAGKRSDESIAENESLNRFLEPDLEEKRAKFSSWAGKRNDLNTKKFTGLTGKQSNESIGDLVIEREEFPGLIVKRSVFSWNSPSVAYKRKPIFSSWGGKRSDDNHSIQARSLPMQRVLINGVKDKSWGSLLRPIRRGPDFYAWGGKRST